VSAWSGHVAALPWQRELELFFTEDLSEVQVITGREYLAVC
jgi:hypothetical protein